MYLKYMKCKKLVAEYKCNQINKEKICFKLNLNNGMTLKIEQGDIRTIIVESQRLVEFNALYAELMSLEKLLQIFEGYFWKLHRMSFSCGDKECTINNRLWMPLRLSYFNVTETPVSLEGCLLGYGDVLTLELFSNWQNIEKEIANIHQIYLYFISNCDLTIDVRCAFMTEIFESIDIWRAQKERKMIN